MQLPSIVNIKYQDGSNKWMLRTLTVEDMPVVSEMKIQAQQAKKLLKMAPHEVTTRIVESKDILHTTTYKFTK